VVLGDEARADQQDVADADGAAEGGGPDVDSLGSTAGGQVCEADAV
jgi:hypothetical protein